LPFFYKIFSISAIRSKTIIVWFKWRVEGGGGLYIFASVFTSNIYLIILMNSIIINNLQWIDVDLSQVIIYILVCMPLLFVGFFIYFMNDTGNQQGKVYDSDRLALALTPYIGSRCIDVGYTFKISRALSQNNITLIYIRNYGNNIAWFHVTPG